MAQGNRSGAAWITRDDIERVKNRVKVGDKLRVKTLKAADVERMSGRYYGVERRSVVVGKYPHFVVVELPRGIQEAILWVDLIIERRGKK